MENVIIKIAELIQRGFAILEDERSQDKTKLQSLKLKLFALGGLIDELKRENERLKQRIKILEEGKNEKN